MNWLPRSFLALIGGTVLLLPQIGLAANDFVNGFNLVDQIRQGAGIRDFGGPDELIISFLRVGLFFLGILALIIFIWGGVLYLTSLGDETRARRAKLLIFYAVLGILVIGLSALAVNLVISLFAVNNPPAGP